MVNQRTIADPGGCQGRTPLSRSNFFHFHADFGKYFTNNRLAPPGVGEPLWETLDSPLKGDINIYRLLVLFQPIVVLDL